MPAAQAVALIAIPVGTPLSDARATLERAGARCNMQRLHPSIMECIYAQRVTVDDYYPADIIWTTRLHGDGVRVTGMTVSRAFDKH
ncbi:hypothetical protein [Sphingomonas paeninsulae]|nr:hypothetical protein [Sphingomonas paeninsulae]